MTRVPTTFAIRVLLLVTAAGSLVLMYRAGHRNPSILLMLMFTAWVSSPFIALDVMNGVSRNWPSPRRTALHAAAVVVALGSVSVYGLDALKPLSSKAAFLYLVVPFASWIIIAGVVVLARSRES